MAKFFQICLTVALVAVCCAEPARLRNTKRSRFSARQELPEDVPAQTPYPPAGIIPQVRFDLPTENLTPENTYLPPDNVGGIPAQTYGPPEPRSTEDDGDLPEDDEEADQTEQPEELEQPQEEEPLNDEAENNELENPQSERLVLRRQSNRRSAKLQTRPASTLKVQRLVAQPIPARSQRLVAQPIYFADGRFFAYTSQVLI